LKTRNNQLKIL